MQKLPILITYILAAAAGGIFLAVAIPRFFYPYEVSWGAGNMFIQVQRVLEHKGLYIQHTVYYVPWLYAPLYYYASAAIATVADLSFVSIRIISLLSTIVLLVIIYKVIRKETK